MSRNPILLAITVLTVTSFACRQDAPPKSTNTMPYAGQDARVIKSLSDEQIDGLMAGEGLGYANVAELNGYPGPRHVLELKTELQLTDAQHAETQALFDRMNAAARQTGRALIEAERRLDSLFALGSAIDSSAVFAAMQRAAELEASLRWTHVRAHLRQTDILTRPQRTLYGQLRGYHGDDRHQHSGADDHSHGT